jgi:hypothetical protein
MSARRCRRSLSSGEPSMTRRWFAGIVRQVEALSLPTGYGWRRANKQVECRRDTERCIKNRLKSGTSWSFLSWRKPNWALPRTPNWPKKRRMKKTA